MNDPLADELIGLPQARIVTSRNTAPVQDGTNDRTIHAWQSFAGQNDPKTVDAHLIAIRDFERFLGGKSFGQVTTKDAAAWRAELIRRAGAPGGGDHLSRSTARHRASHLRQFLDWLCKQPGSRHLDGVSAYLALPRKFNSGPELRPRKIFPTMDEASEMRGGLPDGTLKDRRDRAIFAMAFLAGLRESALVTLRLGDVDLANRRVRHDGRVLRAKNGKSFTVDWFPRTEAFEAVVVAWIAEVRSLGLGDDDALFPGMRTFGGQNLTAAARPAIAPMQTANAVDAVFAKACAGRRPYTPHSARHTLAALGDELCRTPEQRKAWSLNLGHSSEAVTWTHYGRVDDTRKAGIFAEFAVVETWTDAETSLMLRYHAHQLYPGTPEFGHAKRLLERYRSRGDAPLYSSTSPERAIVMPDTDDPLTDGHAP